MAINGMKFFEGLRQWVATVDGREIPVDYHVAELPYGVDAETTYNAEQDAIVVTASTETYSFLEDETPRGTFTVAHEAGHVILHAAQIVRLAERLPHEMTALRRAKEHPIYRDTEWQADGFAAGLLMPLPGLAKLQREGRLTSANAQATFGVSAAAADVRIKFFTARNGGR